MLNCHRDKEFHWKKIKLLNCTSPTHALLIFVEDSSQREFSVPLYQISGTSSESSLTAFNKYIERNLATPIMDSGVSTDSREPVVGASDSTDYQTSLVAEGLDVHPFWSSAKAEGLEDPPPYTAGPSRIISANDGTKDCLALLLTPNLVAALNQITHDILALERKDGALEEIESEITDLSCRADKAKETIRSSKYQERAEEMQLALEILRLKQQEAEERKIHLNIELVPLENSLKFSRAQSQAIFEEALLEACLLDPPEPASPPVLHDVDDDVSSGACSSAPSMYEGTEPTPEQQLLREAHMDVVESYDTLRTYQARFEDRQADYEQKLADFQQAEPESECTRTHFDHQHIQHVQNLTRDLISAEQGYRTAKAKARVLEVAEDPHGLNADSGYLAYDGDRRSDDVSTEPDIGRERIETWSRGVLSDQDAEILEDRERLDLDDWNATPVEIMDSISAIDCDEYVDELNDWKEHCRVLREYLSVQ